MDWDYRWKYVAIFVGIFVGLAGFLALLIKHILSFWISKDIAAYKHKLAMEAAYKIEEIKNQLQAETKASEAKFTRLQEKQAEVISELYGLLQGMHLDMELLDMIARGVTPHKLQPDTERLCGILEKKWRDCFSYYYKHMLFLSDKVNQLMPQAVEYHPYLAEVHYGDFGERLGPLREVVATWRAEHNKVQTVLNQLKIDFNELVGARPSEDLPVPVNLALSDVQSTNQRHA